MIPLEWFTPGEREVWTRRQDGKTYQEIADELGISVKNVSVSLWCARRRIRRNGPPASHTTGRGRAAVAKLVKHTRRFSRQKQCRCGLRGEHECLRASGWDRKPSWMSTGNV